MATGMGIRRYPHVAFRRNLPLVLAALTAVMVLCAAQPASALFIQQGPKVFGTGGSGTTAEGTAVALSADGNTLIVGGPGDNGSVGAAWVFTRSNGIWTQQQKLVGSGNSGASHQGTSVALSADGNTALIGGPDDNTNVGAAWIFTRSGGVWTQQIKLLGTGSSTYSTFGTSVALSGDGNTAAIGGPGDVGSDGTNTGAVWVFTQSSGTWSEQGSKLTGTGLSGSPPRQGLSVALSDNGNTLIFGAPNGGSEGAALVFTRSSGIWNQQGLPLVGNQNTGDPAEGTAVALSSDGNTAIIGGWDDNASTGAAWVFTRSGSTWTQQQKLVGTGTAGPESFQGWSVALSSDGDTALVGGYHDPNTAGGAAWVFSRNGTSWSQVGAKLVGNPGAGDSSGGEEQGYAVALASDALHTIAMGGPDDISGEGASWVFVTDTTNSHDFNGDGTSDILWRNSSSNELAMWLMSAGQLSSGANVAQVPSTWSVVGTRDFNGDGDADILWLDNAGDLAVWLMNGAALSSGISVGNVGTQWSVAGTGDFNDDGTGDILWRNTSTGDVAIWLMSNGTLSSGADLGAISLTWQIVGTGDFNGNGTSDILWRNQSTGDLSIWFLQGGQFSSGADLGTVPLTWTVVGTGDFNGDGTTDILWRDASGDLAVWLISNGAFSSGATLAKVPTTWSVAETGDFNGDGTSDILWTDSSGDVAVWLMSGLSVSAYNSLGNVGTAWQVQGAHAD